MRNAVFFVLDGKEKHKKFGAMIRQKTMNLLTTEQMRLLQKHIRVEIQYEVWVYADAKSFASRMVLVRCGADYDWGTVAFGQLSFGAATKDAFRDAYLNHPGLPACAIITRRRLVQGRTRKSHEIHIYLPELGRTESTWIKAK